MKEIVCSIISLAIIGLTVGVIIWIFGHDTTQQDLNMHSSLLQVVVGLAGTVMGYYFGRIPAENHAAGLQRTTEAAQKNAGEAQKQLSQATEKATEASVVAVRASDAKDRMASRVVALKDDLLRPPAGGGAQGMAVDAIASRLDAILKDSP
jgi:hypothetical protein